ncbi:MAG: STAS domain-containing protein [Paracoccaceae bacterium]
MPGDFGHRLVLSADAGIRSAQEVAKALNDALAQHDRVCVQTEAVTGADITTAQTLLAARIKAARSGKALVMLQPLGTALRELLAAAGFLGAAQDHAGFWTATPELQGGEKP